MVVVAVVVWNYLVWYYNLKLVERILKDPLNFICWP